MGITRAQIARQLLAGGGVSLNDAQTMAPNGEFLAYINPKEAGILKAMGGSGRMTSMGIPSFTEDEEDTGDVSNPGGGSTGGSGGGNNGDDQEDDNARMMQAMGLTGPGFTNRGGGDDSPSLIDRVLGRTTTGINTLKDRLGNRFDRTKNYLTDPSNLKNMATTALLTSLFGPLGMVLSGIGRTGQFQNFLGNLKKDDLVQGTNTIEDTELRSLKPNFLLPDTKPVQLGTTPYTDISNQIADVSQMDLDLKGMTKGYSLNDARGFTGNTSLTQEELDGIRDGTITAPTGRFIT
tara:strand:- start:45 stop:923 length:879 start_codon:yes stop_codon:yes gene_type:complete